MPEHQLLSVEDIRALGILQLVSDEFGGELEVVVNSDAGRHMIVVLVGSLTDSVTWEAIDLPGVPQQIATDLYRRWRHEVPE